MPFNWDDFVSFNNSSLIEGLLNKTLIKITDILGREISLSTTHQTVLYIYDDGSVEKRYKIE